MWLGEVGGVWFYILVRDEIEERLEVVIEGLVEKEFREKKEIVYWKRGIRREIKV